jgi:hypothetical protein
MDVVAGASMEGFTAPPKRPFSRKTPQARAPRAH